MSTNWNIFGCRSVDCSLLCSRYSLMAKTCGYWLIR